MTKTCPHCHATVLSTSQPASEFVLMPREATRAMTMAGCDMLPSCEHVFGHAGEMLRNAYRKMVEVAALAATPALNDEAVKLAYIKRWRTIVNLPAKYADEIVEALRVPATPASLESLIREYARDLRRNSSGGDDYPWDWAKATADYLEVLIGRAATPAGEDVILEQSEDMKGNWVQTVRLANGEEIVRKVPQCAAAPAMRDLVERLRNPMWVHSGVPVYGPYLDREENLAAMNEAADILAAVTPSGTQGALALYLNEVKPVNGRVQIDISIDELSVLRRLIAAGGEAMPDPNYKWGMDYGKDLLKDINQLAHAAGTGGLHRDMLQRAYREIRRLTPAADIPPCPVCHAPYHLEGAERYWEARWRDEKAENDRLRAAASPAPGESEDEPGPISGRYGRQRRPLSAANRDDLQESAKLLATPVVGGEAMDRDVIARAIYETEMDEDNEAATWAYAKMIAETWKGRGPDYDKHAAMYQRTVDDTLAQADSVIAAQPASPLRGRDSLETLIRKYARDLRRNSSGGDDYPFEIMTGVADYLEVLIGRASPPEQPLTKLGSSEPLGPLYDGTTMDNQQLHGTTRRNQPVVTAGETAPPEQPAAAPVMGRLTFCEKCSANRVHYRSKIIDGVQTFECPVCFPAAPKEPQA